MIGFVNAVACVNTGSNESPDHSKRPIDDAQGIYFIRMNLASGDALWKFDNVECNPSYHVANAIGYFSKKTPNRRST